MSGNTHIMKKYMRLPTEKQIFQTISLLLLLSSASFFVLKHAKSSADAYSGRPYILSLKERIIIDNFVLKKKIGERPNSFFFVLNRMSPKARDTAMSPQILPLPIYRHHKNTCYMTCNMD